MKSFRERLGIRQDFDNWAKGINNTLANLQKQGFEQEARQNIDTLKAQGFTTITDKNGNEILSRATDNKKLYKEHTKQETEQIKKDLWNVKKAKAKPKEEPQPPGEPRPPIGDRFESLDVASDFYNLCELAAEELDNFLGAKLYTPNDIKNAFNARGTHFGNFKDNKYTYVDEMRAMLNEYYDYYNQLKNTYDDDYIDL